MKLVNESWKSQSKAGRLNPATVLLIRHKGKKVRCVLGCGSSDSISVFLRSDLLFVVNVNHGLQYAGLQVFDLADNYGMDGCPIGEVFLQADYEIAGVLGPRGTDLSPLTIAKRLEPHAIQDN